MEDRTLISVRDLVFIYKPNSKGLILEWEGSERNDIIGDCLSYMLYNMAQYDDSNLDIFENIKREKQANEDSKKENRKEEYLELIKNALSQSCGISKVMRENGFICVYGDQ